MRGCDLVVDAAIALEVYQSFRSDIIDEPADLVGMRFDHHFKRRVGVDDADGGSIGIGKMGVDIGGQVVEPKFLPAALKTYRGGVIDVFFQEIPGPSM
jgi:hypothetical protein